MCHFHFDEETPAGGGVAVGQEVTCGCRTDTGASQHEV